MTKLILILLIPSILFCNLNLYNVTYLSNGETNKIENVIFISKDGYLFTFKSVDVDERYFYIYQGDIINIKDLRIDEFIYNYDTFSENQKTISQTLNHIGLLLPWVTLVGIILFFSNLNKGWQRA